jgi:hypothetical protein
MTSPIISKKNRYEKYILNNMLNDVKLYLETEYCLKNNLKKVYTIKLHITLKLLLSNLLYYPKFIYFTSSTIQMSAMTLRLFGVYFDYVSVLFYLQPLT